MLLHKTCVLRGILQKGVKDHWLVMDVVNHIRAVVPNLFLVCGPLPSFKSLGGPPPNPVVGLYIGGNGVCVHSCHGISLLRQPFSSGSSSARLSFTAHPSATFLKCSQEKGRSYLKLLHLSLCTLAWAWTRAEEGRCGKVGLHEPLRITPRTPGSPRIPGWEPLLIEHYA